MTPRLGAKRQSHSIYRHSVSRHLRKLIDLHGAARFSILALQLRAVDSEKMRTQTGRNYMAKLTGS